MPRGFPRFSTIALEIEVDHHIRRFYSTSWLEASVQTIAKTCVRTLRLKVKSESYPWLNAAAAEVNVVWNYANEISARAA
jgi:hypothetical protein